MKNGLSELLSRISFKSTFVFLPFPAVLFSLSLAFSIAGCAKSDGPICTDNQGGEKITFVAGVPEDAYGSADEDSDTKVAYDDANLKLTWESGDKLAAVGFDGDGAYVGVSRDFTYEGTAGATSGAFEGTAVTGATKYNVYYPANVTVATDGSVSLSMEGQTQTADGSAAHLKYFTLLEAKNATPSGNFMMTMKSSILKLNFTGVNKDIGKLYSIVMSVATPDETTEIQTLHFANNAVTFSSSKSTLTAYMSFLPDEISGVKNTGAFKIICNGARQYTATITSSGKTYYSGKRYKSDISSMTSSTASGAYMSYTIRTTVDNTDVDAGLMRKSDYTTDEETKLENNITIYWGDGNSSTLTSGSHVVSPSNTYEKAGTYTVTIVSAKTDVSKVQITDFDFDGSGGSSGTNTAAYLISLDTPLLNSKQITFRYCFRNCSKLVSISAGLFDNNTASTSFDECFYGCNTLNSVPENLFDKTTVATQFYYCFYDCWYLVLNKNIFNLSRLRGQGDADLSYCFKNAGSKLLESQRGKAPELWISPNSNWKHTGCFDNAYFSNSTDSDSFTSSLFSSWGTPKGRS